MTDESDSRVKGAVEIDPIKGKVAVSGEVSGFAAIANAFRSPRAKIQHAAAERITNLIRSGQPLHELSPFDQALLMEAMGDTLVKAMNKAEVVKRALAHEPNLAGLLVAPGASEVREEYQTATEKAVEQQRFWDRFWADAETVSVEYMQEMYARILAGNVKTPGSFSLATLDVLRCLDNRTAKVFEDVLSYALGTGVIPNVFKGKNGAPGLLELMALEDSKLISSTDAQARAGHPYEYHRWFIRTCVNLGRISPKIYVLSQAGRELASFIEFEITEDHVVAVCRGLTIGESVVEAADSPEGPWLPWKEFFKDEVAKVDAKIASSTQTEQK